MPTNKQNKLRGFSPPTNYTDRATAAVGEVSTNFSGQRVSRGQRNESPRPWLDHSNYTWKRVEVTTLGGKCYVHNCFSVSCASRISTSISPRYLQQPLLRSSARVSLQQLCAYYRTPSGTWRSICLFKSYWLVLALKALPDKLMTKLREEDTTATRGNDDLKFWCDTEKVRTSSNVKGKWSDFRKTDIYDMLLRIAWRISSAEIRPRGHGDIQEGIYNHSQHKI
jgi:hypothetical protein